MRKLAIAVSVALTLGACTSFSWTGAPQPSSEEQSLGIKDVATLSRQAENEAYWRNMRRTMDGRTNALSRDLGAIADTINLHFFNYSKDDPYVNHETDQNYLTATIGWVGDSLGTNVLPWVPVR